MTYVLGFTIAHVEIFRPFGRHLCEVVRLRDGISEVLRVPRLRRW